MKAESGLYLDLRTLQLRYGFVAGSLFQLLWVTGVTAVYLLLALLALPAIAIMVAFGRVNTYITPGETK